MNYNTVYVGMDVHKETFSLCCYTNEKEQAEYPQKVDGHYSKVLNYLEAMRFHYGDDAVFICGYEAGCLGKTDKRDAARIARCLAHHDYSQVHIPTDQDEQVKEYIRMRQDHKAALKKVKQQILAFCLRHNYRYDGTKTYWTQAHLKWLRALRPEGLYQEILTEYLSTYDQLMDKLERFDKRIEELASDKAYQENVRRMSCFLGIKTQTALSTIVEVGDFKRFASAQQFASYLGLTPGEDSSGGDQNRLGITKAGNSHVRTLLVEAAQSYTHGRADHKSKLLKERQYGNPANIIAYADKANERLRRRYYHLVLRQGKKANVAKTAVARELACFIWGMMTEDIA